MLFRSDALEVFADAREKTNNGITQLELDKFLNPYGRETVDVYKRQGINRPYLKYRLSQGGKSRNKAKSAIMTYQVYRYVGLSLIHIYVAKLTIGSETRNYAVCPMSPTGEVGETQMIDLTDLINMRKFG